MKGYIVIRSHAPFVHESCAVAKHYKFISTVRFHAPFMHALCTFHGSNTLDFHAALSCMLCVHIGSSMTFHQLDSHIATPHFVHALCALAMFFVYKSHFTCSHEPVLEIHSGLQDRQID